MFLYPFYQAKFLKPKLLDTLAYKSILESKVTKGLSRTVKDTVDINKSNLECLSL